MRSGPIWLVMATNYTEPGLELHRRRASLAAVATRAKLPKPRKRRYGTGSVVIQDGRYRAQFTNLKTGQRDSERFETNEEAQAFLDRWYAQKLTADAERKEKELKRRRSPNPNALPQAPPAAPGTFGELIKDWRKSKVGTVAPGTWRNYDPALNALAYYLGDFELNAISEEHIQAYRDGRIAGTMWQPARLPDGSDNPDAGKPVKVKPLSPATVNQHIDRAHDVFQWALDRRPPRIEHNPADLYHRDRLRVITPEPTVITGDEIEALLAAAPEDAKLEFALMGHLALRWGEALGVGVAHIVKERDGKTWVRVRQQAIENREAKPARIEIADYVKSRHGQREFVASPAIVAAATAAYARLGGSPNPFEILRPTRTGAPYRYGNWRREFWEPAVKAAGLDPELNPHDLRHSRLSAMASSGQVTVVDLYRFAGHHNPAYTLSRYAKWFAKSGLAPDTYLAGLSPKLLEAALAA